MTVNNNNQMQGLISPENWI